MAGKGSFAGSGGGAPTVGQVGNTTYATVDPSSGQTYSNILGQVQNRLPGPPPSYQDFLSQGVNSPLIQTVMQPALRNLQDQFSLQNQQFNDEFRSAGALGSGAQAVGMGRLAQAQGNAQGNLIAQILTQMLPQISQGLNQQYQNQLAVPGLLASVLGTAKPQVVSGTTPNINFRGGGGGGGGAGSSPSEADTIFNNILAGKYNTPSTQTQTDNTLDFDLSNLGLTYPDAAIGATWIGPDGVVQSDNSDSGLLGYGQGYMPSGEEDVGQPIFAEEY